MQQNCCVVARDFTGRVSWLVGRIRSARLAWSTLQACHAARRAAHGTSWVDGRARLAPSPRRTRARRSSRGALALGHLAGRLCLRRVVLVVARAGLALRLGNGQLRE